MVNVTADIEAEEDVGEVHVAVLPAVVLQEVTYGIMYINYTGSMLQQILRLMRMRERLMWLSCQ
jgi:hypothetical protein